MAAQNLPPVPSDDKSVDAAARALWIAMGNRADLWEQIDGAWGIYMDERRKTLRGYAAAMLAAVARG